MKNKMKRIMHSESTYTASGKIISSKRQKGETIGAMSQKLGFNASYLSSVLYGKKSLTYSIYEKFCKMYAVTEKEKDVMKIELLSKEVCDRAEKIFGKKVSYDDLLYVIYGVEKF